MARPSYLEPGATDSQDLDHLDSVSLFSEPRDIRNWFSSYIYESPELNTLDGFQDSDGSAETCLEEEKNEKSGDSEPVGKTDDAPLAAPEKSSEGDKFNESDELECSKSAAVVRGSSESLSFSSEPPDIKNWFSSYLYESPLLDTSHDFTFSEYTEREPGKLYDVEKSYRQDIKDEMAFIDVEETTELCSQSRITDAVVKCTSLVKDTKLDHQTVCKDVHNVVSKPFPSIPSQSTSDEVSNPKLSRQSAGNNSHSHVEMYGSISKYGNDYDGRLHCSSTDGRRPKLLIVENNIGSWNRQSIRKSIVRIHCVKDGLENNNHGYVEMSGNTSTYVNDYDGKLHCSSPDERISKLTNVENTMVSWDRRSVHKLIGRIDYVKDGLENNDRGYIEMSGNISKYVNDYDVELHCSSPDGRRPKLMNAENSRGSGDGKSVSKSIGRIDCVKDDLEKEGLHDIVSPGTLHLTVPEGDSGGRPTDTSSNEKENEENEFLENGFISIRKRSRRANAGNVTRRVQVEVESRSVVKSTISHEKDGAKIVRKVFSEISNFCSPDTQETTGKWRCAQKNKPNLGPPLKQLRLDQLFYRL